MQGTASLDGVPLSRCPKDAYDQYAVIKRDSLTAVGVGTVAAPT